MQSTMVGEEIHNHAITILVPWLGAYFDFVRNYSGVVGEEIQ